MSGNGTTRAFVLGFDGVPWALIDRWTDEGRLPNFAGLLADGAGGPLRSTTPASTPLAWPSIATGVWPDKHGIYDFQALTSGYAHRMYTREDICQPRLWEMVSPAVVANVPMTYPAKPIDGTLVAGMMAPTTNERYTHPPELAATIKREIPEYEIALNWGEYAGEEARLIEDIGSLLEARRRLMELLMETDDWRLFFFTYLTPDRLQHLVWDEEILLDHYEHLDDILGQVRAYVAERGANLFVVSDHGFGPVTRQVAVNTLLEKQGYLRRKEADGRRGALETLGVTKSRLRSLLSRLGVDEGRLVRYLPDAVVDQVAATVPGDHALYDVDHAETRAFVHGFGNLYVNDSRRFDEGIVNPADVPQLKAELIDLFAGLTEPGTGTAPIEVHDGTEIFPNDDRSPDLVLEAVDAYKLTSALGGEVFETPQVEASHRPEGIFLAWGPDVASGSSPQNATVVDVVPTILESMGKLVPESVDGRILDEVLVSGRDIERRPVETGGGQREEPLAADEDLQSVQNRLQGLGYMEE